MTPYIKYVNSGKSRAAIAVLALICTAVPARTQESQQNPAHQLDNLVVVANRFEMKLDQVGSTVEIIDRNELERLNQPLLLEAIRTVPGFYLRNTGGPGGAFGITTRGLNSNRPTFLIDGIEVANPATGLSINPGNLVSSSVSSIELLKGPQSALYGADSLAGVISINTSDGRTAPSNTFSASYGSRNTLDASLGLNGERENLSWSLNLNRHETDGYSAQNPDYGPEWADDDAYENTVVSAKLNYALNESSELFALVYYLDSFAEFDPGTPSPWSTPILDNFSEDEQTFAKVGGNFDHTDSWSSQLSFGYTNVNSFQHSSWPLTNNGDTYQLDWKNDIRVTNSLTIVAGVEYDIEDYRSDVGDRENTSFFVENILAANENLDLTFGARYDDNSAYGSETTWRSSFNYRIDQLDARVRGSYGTSFQAPTFFQLFSFYGDPDIKAESGDGWDLGFSKAFNNSSILIETTLFGYDIDDKINYSFATNRYANEERYQSEGLETSLNWWRNENLSFRLSHTYTDARYGDQTEAERVPRNVIALGANWSSRDKRININATAYKVSSQFSLRGDANKQTGYTTVNLSTHYNLSEQHTLWVRIDNLLDEEYQEVTDFLTPGASLFGGLRYKF